MCAVRDKQKRMAWQPAPVRRQAPPPAARAAARAKLCRPGPGHLRAPGCPPRRAAHAGVSLCRANGAATRATRLRRPALLGIVLYRRIGAAARHHQPASRLPDITNQPAGFDGPRDIRLLQSRHGIRSGAATRRRPPSQPASTGHATSACCRPSLWHTIGAATRRCPPASRLRRARRP